MVLWLLYVTPAVCSYALAVLHKGSVAIYIALPLILWVYDRIRRFIRSRVVWTPTPYTTASATGEGAGSTKIVYLDVSTSGVNNFEFKVPRDASSTASRA
jgi:hypothetical protein